MEVTQEENLYLTEPLLKDTGGRAPIPATKVMRYGPSQLSPNFPQAGSLIAPKTFFNTKSPGANDLSFTLVS